MSWNPSAKFCASSAHVGWAAFIVLAFHAHLPFVWGLGISLALAKEFWADLFWLEHDSVTGSTLDFATYLLGGLIGTVAGFSLVWAAALALVIILFLTILDMTGVL